jgi:hypothetical protein
MWENRNRHIDFRGGAPVNCPGCPTVNLHKAQAGRVQEVSSNTTPRCEQNVSSGQELREGLVLLFPGPDGIDPCFTKRGIEKITNPIGKILEVNRSHEERSGVGVEGKKRLAQQVSEAGQGREPATSGQSLRVQSDTR